MIRMEPQAGSSLTIYVEQIAAEDVLDQAYARLCARRKRFPDV